MKFKYMIETGTDPYHNLATEQELLRHVTSGTTILYLWQNDNTIVVGRNQDVYSECMAEDFLSEGGRIARRRSGGGAVYHDLGNLNFSILCSASEQKLCRYQKLVIEVLERFDIQPKYNGRNDIVIHGRKCSGNAIYQEGDVVCQHGTLLIATNIERMFSLLTPDKSKLDRNHVASVASRVINLSKINRAINVESMIWSFIEVTKACKLESPLDLNRVRKLIDFYKSEAWVYGGKQ